MNPLIKADKSINNIRNLNKCVMSPLPLARVCVALWRVHVAAPVWMMAVMFRRERLCCFPLSSMSLVIFPRHQCGINVWAGWLGSGLVGAAPHPLGPSPFFLPPTSRRQLHPQPHVCLFQLYNTNMAELVIILTISVCETVLGLFLSACCLYLPPLSLSSPSYVRGGSNGSFSSDGSSFSAKKMKKPSCCLPQS